HSLCRYYDAVAIPGLELAHQDWERGVLDKGQLQELYEVSGEVIEDLDEYDDTTPKRENNQKEPKEGPESRCDDLAILEPIHLPPGWRNGHVLVIGGRTPIDAAGAAILAQLLNKHGVPAYMPSPGHIGRAFFQEDSLPKTHLICVS